MLAVIIYTKPLNLILKRRMPKARTTWVNKLYSSLSYIYRKYIFLNRGIQIYRFYISCPRCSQQITFKTDPKNADYVIEHGATS
jgi:DNA-directed RNA polymerase subunit RPC12/RpoP